MVKDKYIIVACDDYRLLQFILAKIQDIKEAEIILASRVSDLLSIRKTTQPELIISCFRNTQKVINDLRQFFPGSKVPLLCLLRKHNNEYLKWNPENIVFTHMLDIDANKNNLFLRINSILQLGKLSIKTKKIPELSLVEKNIRIASDENLARHVMELDQKNRTISRIKNRIEKIYEHAEGPIRQKLLAVINSIKSNSRDNKVWADFKTYFDKIDPRFIKRLKEIHPELTPLDIKYCCYLKMNMSNEEIRCIFGISLESVRTHKYRLKKKLELMKDQNLQSYLVSIPEDNQVKA